MDKTINISLRFPSQDLIIGVVVGIIIGRITKRRPRGSS